MAPALTRQALYFTAPRQVELRPEPLAPPGPGEVLVETKLSAISPGTESLVYRGQVPRHLPLDESLADFGGRFEFPFKYGYALVGQVRELGAGVAATWRERWVFAFHPHESHFVTRPAQLIPLPAGLAPEEALFLPNVETAVNLVLDGAPLLGETVLVFGQGIVGLLTTALLAQFPLGQLITVDPIPQRRERSLALGADRSLTPAALTADLFPAGVDLSYELSGNPAALDQAIAQAGFAGRIIVGAWYGSKTVSLDLGSRFHRQRLQLISSQVSTLAPALQGRWDKARRLELAWQKLAACRPAHFITHRLPFAQAGQAYALLDQTPEQAIQVVLTY